MPAYMVSAPATWNLQRYFPIAEPNRLSRDFLHANRLALRDALAVPIRAKARRGYKARKSNVGEDQKAEHRHDEQGAQHVPALRIPPGNKSHGFTIAPVRAGSGSDFMQRLTAC
jgi:hypothetical protein